MNRASATGTGPQTHRQPEMPTFPEKRYSILEFGAVGDGATMNTEAVNRAIETCSSEGGGTVVIPPGIWLTGPIRLQSGVNLHAQQGALVLFSRNFDDYPLIPTSYEGIRTVRCMSNLYGENLTDVAITGEGIFDGSGDAWRPVKRMKMTEHQWKALTSSGGVTDPTGRMWWPTEKAMQGASTAKRLLAEGERRTEAFEEARDFLRPALLQLDRCTRVLLDGPTFQNSPSWCLHPWLCEHVTVRNVHVKNPWYSQNGDGLDLDSCRYVDVSDSRFDVGDDAICIKSGKDADGRELGVPCQDIVIRGCVVYHGHGGFVIGSEMSGGVRNVSISDCLFIGTDSGLRFKSARGRGGVVEKIRIRNIRMTGIPKAAITFSMFYGHGGADRPAAEEVSAKTPAFRDFQIEHIRCIGAHRAIELKGLPEMPVENIRFEHIDIKATKGISLENARDVRFADVSVTPMEGPLFSLQACSDIRIERTKRPAAGQLYMEAGGAETSGIEIRGIAGEAYEVNGARETDASQIRIYPEEARESHDD
ncbi:glycoside hydrolase family 28 protein [Paenibacillus arenilitoris]|uniref:glycoside hydrolase family 28 protein n=1 Tax=Paenibacillus arenilitoris TaxID=2772299 RepID=UPI001CC250CB|nr:glycoside hydrolase family 28 protein [Paenibacillus arenilitoris]